MTFNDLLYRERQVGNLQAPTNQNAREQGKKKIKKKGNGNG
jgi:hypothetical protein